MKFIVVVMDGFAIAFSDPPIVRQFKHGQSNPTYYVEYGGQRLVIRKKPVSNQPALITIEITLNCIRMRRCLLSRFITGCTKQELFGEAQLAHNQIFVTVMSPYYFTHQIAVNLVLQVHNRYSFAISPTLSSQHVFTFTAFKLFSKLLLVHIMSIAYIGPWVVKYGVTSV